MLVRNRSARVGRGDKSNRFSYETLGTAVRDQIREEAQVIHSMMALISKNVLQVGLRLQLVRRTIGRDNF